MPPRNRVTKDRRTPGSCSVRTWPKGSPARPNPIGLHRVQIVSIDGLRVQVRHLEALDGTPIVDVKPLLEPIGER
jgi:tRNA (Thr-GGU) A37 N-methylase